MASQQDFVHFPGGGMLYFYVSLAYSIANLILAGFIIARSARNTLSQFYAFGVISLVLLACAGYFLQHPVPGLPLHALEDVAAFIFSLSPFFFVHFMLIFVRRLELLKSRTVLVANYFAGLFSYAMVLLGFIPKPFSVAEGITMAGFVYYVTWMSIYFSIGVAQLYSLIGGFKERAGKSNLPFIAVATMMLLLPTPFTLSVFSAFSGQGTVLYFISSTSALVVLVFVVFRHRITMNTPYQTMKTALAAMNDILVTTNVDFVIEFAQGAVRQVFGGEEQQVKGKSLRDMVEQRELLDGYRYNVLGGTSHEQFFVVDVISFSGETHPIEFSFTPVLANEEVIGFVGVGRDISERRLAEKAFAESEARYRSLFECSPIPMWVNDSENLSFLVVNDAAVRHYGFSREEFMSMTYRDIVPKGEGTGELTRAQDFSVKHRTRDGSSIDVEITLHEMTFDGRAAWLVVITDVTERKLAEDALRTSEERYRSFFEEDLTGDIIVTAGGQLLACNPAFVRMFGFASMESALGSDFAALFPATGGFESLLAVLQEKHRLEYHETAYRRLDGGVVQAIQNVIGMFDETGTLVSIKCYIFDNTERKRLEDQLRQAQKMENLGTLAGGIAHDFNNILAIILGNASLIEQQKTFPHAVTQRVETIRRSVERAAGMVRQLMTFARKSEALFEPVSINTSLEELAGMLNSTFPKTIAIATRPDPTVPAIIADPNQVHQALLNLCVNARDAMLDPSVEEGRQLSLNLASGLTPGNMIRHRFADATAEQYVCIRVSDTGMGMSEATRHHIFEPFFTTKEAGKGTGLGLSVVYGVMRSHRGFAEVESTPGVGTTFSLYFPVPPRNLKHVSREGIFPASVEGGSEVILLVEDEEMLLESLKSLLEGKGYHVLTARDGVEAVERFRSHQKDIAFVLSDMGLPKMSGWEAFQQMKQLNPDVKIVFGSGGIDPAVRAKMVRGGARDFIQKPYIPDEILRRIREVIAN